ncbi:MAG: flagellar biosynthesis regulator FlaF [Desulfobacteraceae bacterium]|nr:MAG: flagellar biosynthesis regulator FlaF [Desulfobacteraceae bacterium]
MYRNPLEAYQTVDRTTMSGREVEARVLSQAALKLKDCQNNWDAEDRDARLDEALKYNQRIWSIFQGELAKEDNPLPKQLKQDLISLAAFIDRRIFDTMAFPALEKLTVVININQNIAAGLRGSPANDQ